MTNVTCVIQKGNKMVTNFGAILLIVVKPGLLSEVNKFEARPQRTLLLHQLNTFIFDVIILFTIKADF